MPSTPANTASSEFPLGREPRPGLLSQISAELLWPKLLRSVGLAMRPERLFIGAVVLLTIATILRIPGYWAGEGWTEVVSERLFTVEWSVIGWRLISLDVEGAAIPLLQFAAHCRSLWDISWWTTLIVLPLVLLVWGVGGCAICRIAAADVAHGTLVAWGEGARFAWQRKGSVLFALLAPLVLGVLIWFGLAAGGWVLFSVAWVNLLGGMLYVFFILAAILAVVVLVAYAVGFPLIVPAVAVEGADEIDALARAYPYVFGKPLKYAAYVIILVLLGQVAVTVASWGAKEVVSFSRGAATTWTGESADRIMAAARAETIPEEPPYTSSERATARVIRLWETIVDVVVGAFVVSYFFCGSTVLYLIMRRVCDGQDLGEIWMPGMIEGTMAMTMESRVKASAAAVVPRPGDAADET